MTQLHLDLYSSHVMPHVHSQLFVAVFMTQNVTHLHAACLPYRMERQLVLFLLTAVLASVYCYFIVTLFPVSLSGNVRRLLFLICYGPPRPPPHPSPSTLLLGTFIILLVAAFVKNVTRNRWRKSQSVGCYSANDWMSSVNQTGNLVSCRIS